MTSSCVLAMPRHKRSRNPSQRTRHLHHRHPHHHRRRLHHLLRRRLHRRLPRQLRQDLHRPLDQAEWSGEYLHDSKIAASNVFKTMRENFWVVKSADGLELRLEILRGEEEKEQKEEQERRSSLNNNNNSRKRDLVVTRTTTSRAQLESRM